MAKQICGTCNGTGWDEVDRAYRGSDVKTHTVTEKITCKTCGGSGWVNM